MQLRQPRQRHADVARGNDDRDPLRHESPSDERERLRRRAIEPLGVIDDAEDGLLLGRLGDESQDGESDEIRVRGIPGAQSEGDGKRLALRVRQALPEFEVVRGELLKRRVWELHLAFHADRSGDAERSSALNGVFQQRRLADARLSMDDEHAAVSLAGGLQQPVDGLALREASDKLLGRRCRGGAHPGRWSIHVVPQSVGGHPLGSRLRIPGMRMVSPRRHDQALPTQMKE
jgi:hypothetical protein